MKIIFKKPYIYFILGIFLVYLTLTVILSGFYDTFRLILIYAETINWIKLSISLILTLLIGILVSINTVFVYLRYKERKRCIRGNVSAGIGTISGLAIGVCPLCVSGILPLIFGLLGVSFSFAALPFGGIELQVLILVILLFSLNMLNKSKNN